MKAVHWTRVASRRLRELLPVLGLDGDSARKLSRRLKRVTQPAIAGSIVLQVLVVQMPFLQRAFGTVGLTARDWLFCVLVASSVLWIREASKLMTRGMR